MLAMDTLLSPPVATTFEAFAAVVSAALYLIVGGAVFLQSPRDVRARVFFATALTSAGPYSVTALIWSRGSGAAFTLPVIITVGLSLMLGSLALFHFTQVFPWRRPWVRAHGRWLIAGYLVIPLLFAIALWPYAVLFKEYMAVADSGSGGLGAVAADGTFVGLLLLIALPAIFVLGVVVPFAAILSLFNSWRAAKASGVWSARVTTIWILISQMGGGVLTILIIPLLHLVAPAGPWVAMAAALLFAFGLLMPLAFAAGVWKYRVLDLDVDGLPEAT
jgi:hypothetical protein